MPRQRYRLEPRRAAAYTAGASAASGIAWQYLKKLAAQEANIQMRKAYEKIKVNRARGRPKGSKNTRNTRTRGVYNPKPTNGFVGRGYAGAMRIASKDEITKIKRPLKGNFKPRGTLVVNRKRGKRLRAQKISYPHSVYQTYYLSTVNLDDKGNIGSLDRNYTNMSVDSRHGTGILLNLGANCIAWDPTKYKIGNLELPAGGDATTDNPNILWQIKGDNTGIDQPRPIMLKQSKLPETATPYQQGTTPPVLKYVVPNHVIGQIDLNLSFTSGSICDQILTISVLRNISNEPTQPGMWSNTGPNGGIAGADTIKVLCNDIKNVTGKQYETLFSTTRYLKGIHLQQKDPTVYYVKKRIKCNYSRSTCRRVTSSLNNSILAGQWSPTFEIDQSGAMFNNIVVRIMSKCITNDKIVTNYKGMHSSAGTVDYYGIPKNLDMDAPEANEYWQNCTYLKSRFRYGGTCGLKCYVRDHNRGLGGEATIKITDLQDQINDLTSQLGALTDYGEEHVAELDAHVADEDAHNHESCSESEEECEQTVTAHVAGAPVATDHGHPNSLTAEEHRQTMGGCPHSH